MRELQIYGGLVERQFSEVRRPATFRRLVAATLGSWSVRAATLARDTRVEVSIAWRSLEPAADLGLVVEVPGQKRPRGDQTLYAAPPWLRKAGLMLVRRGRPAALSIGHGGEAALKDAIAELDVAIAATDALVAA